MEGRTDDDRRELLLLIVATRTTLFVWLACAGCGFEHGAYSPPGISGDDNAPIDSPAGGSGSGSGVAGMDALTWTTVESIVIPIANGAQVTSAMTLATGTTYHLRVSGSYVTDPNGNLQGDADYYDYANPKDVTVIGTPIDVGVGIDDATSDGDKQPKWGAYTTTHIYEIAFTGKGAPIKANVHDGNYTNDSGMLTLEILELR